MTAPTDAPPETPLASLLTLARRVRHAANQDELAFLAVNDTHALAPYRQAALWFADGGVRSLSGVVQAEANAPYVLWLEQVCRQLAGLSEPTRTGGIELPAPAGDAWAEWLPACGLWLPFPGGGCLLARDAPWHDDELALLGEWIDIWHHGWQARQPRIAWSWRRGRDRLIELARPAPDRPWWRQTHLRWAAGVLALLLFPVRLTVLAPGELVPANPAVIRAPLDGVVHQFFVKPNEPVKAGQPLFGFDSAVLASRYDVAAQAMATAEAEYRQAAQQALSDTKSKSQLTILTGKIEEKRAEADYLRDQLQRAQVLAPTDGLALFDDPMEWVGKPVLTGERIMRVATPGDVEVEAWLGLGDAIPLAAGSAVSLYLSAAPLSSVAARIRYVAHDAAPRPDGSHAYRVRATLDSPSDHRVGLKGTAKLHGDWVPLAYWVLRRPWVKTRQFLGL